MLHLNNLSKIGFGTYRVSVASPEHLRALSRALHAGCNLLDTSTNYMNGQSEEAVGRALAESPDLEAFVVTKAGYIQGDNLAVLQELNARGLARDDVVTFSDDYKYSIHPDFLRSQIALSCRRLGRHTIDGLLLHNPEHCLEVAENGGIGEDDYYSRIRRAFEFLEEMVSVGTVRYYGVSSNTLPLSLSEPGTTDLTKVLAAAESVSSGHHFKLIQFPFNMMETEAIKPQHGDTSLVALARSKSLVTLTNRPLNAKTARGSLRIATYEDATRELDKDRDRHVFDVCLELIRRQLQRSGMDDDPMEFTAVRFLRDSWMEIQTPDLVAEAFHGHFYPFLTRLYDDRIPQEELEAYAKLQHYATLYSKRAMTERASAFRHQLIAQGIIAADDLRPLPLIACARYLSSGIDHVLVGMRSAAYVDALRPLF